MKIALASDHGGLHLKEHIKQYLIERGYTIIDHGTCTEESCDYPQYAAKLCRDLADGVSGAERGILVCGTGIGVCIAANKCRGIRAALCSDVYAAKMSREHNDANVLCLGERITGAGLAEMIVDVWLATEFAGGRHARRVAQLMELEEEQ